MLCEKKRCGFNFICGEYNVLLFNNNNNDDDGILNSPYKYGSQLC